MFHSNKRQWFSVVHGVSVLTLLLGLVFGTTLNANAAHESNNSAEVSGAGGMAGKAIVNYVKGVEGWSSTVSVSGLESGSYVFAVRLNAGAFQTVCSFKADGKGKDGCNDQDAELLGFNEAVIVEDINKNGIADALEIVVALGKFERRGVCREPDQGNVDCPNEGKP